MDDRELANRIAMAYFRSPMLINSDIFTRRQYQWLAAMGMVETLKMMGIPMKCLRGSMK